MAENHKFAIISSDSVGCILSVNEYACALFGIPKGSFIGINVRGICVCVCGGWCGIVY
jgi:PAS domain-containing protein